MAQCKGCGANIRWVETAKGKMMPLDAQPRQFFKIIPDFEGNDRVKIEFGHITHWETCPKAGKFKKKGKKEND